MTYQPELDFKNIVHTRENNSFSESILFDQYDRLSNNCKVIYQALKRGEKLTGWDIIEKYKIAEYRRRFADLREAGVEIQERTLKNGSKVWWMEI